MAYYNIMVADEKENWKLHTYEQTIIKEDTGETITKTQIFKTSSLDVIASTCAELLKNIPSSRLKVIQSVEVDVTSKIS